MKKTKKFRRLAAVLTAALTAVSVTSSFLSTTAFAEAPALESVPCKYDSPDTDFYAVCEEMEATYGLECTKESIYDRVEKAFGVDSYQDLTYSEAYRLYYDLDYGFGEDGFYLYFVYQNDEPIGMFEMYRDYIVYDWYKFDSNSIMYTLLASGNDMWFGSGKIDSSQGWGWRNLVYSDGVLYDIKDNVATEYVPGHLPHYSKYEDDTPSVSYDEEEWDDEDFVFTTTAETTTAQTTTTTTQVGAKGDVNLDGAIDLADAVILNKAINGNVVLDNDAKRNAADCNRDGVLSTEDGVALMRYLVHHVDTL